MAGALGHGEPPPKPSRQTAPSHPGQQPCRQTVGPAGEIVGALLAASPALVWVMVFGCRSGASLTISSHRLDPKTAKLRRGDDASGRPPPEREAKRQVRSGSAATRKRASPSPCPWSTTGGMRRHLLQEKCDTVRLVGHGRGLTNARPARPAQSDQRQFERVGKRGRAALSPGAASARGASGGKCAAAWRITERPDMGYCT